MGVKRREEWYEVTRGDVGEEVRLHFNDIGDLVANVLQVAYPDHGPWDLGKFTNFSKSTTQQKMKELFTRFDPFLISFFFFLFSFFFFLFLFFSSFPSSFTFSSFLILLSSVKGSFQIERSLRTTHIHFNFFRTREKS